jgi:hypothetical protein
MKAERFPVFDHQDREIAEVILGEVEGVFTLERTPFINSFKLAISPADAKRLSAAAANRDWATLNAFNPELLPWYCPKCGCNYAGDSWKVWAKFDDDPDCHWFDSYRGVCPRGHERMVAD